MGRRRQAGFTLLEAIVAMVVMATALLTLYSWLSSSTLALGRAQAQHRALEDARAAFALVADVNPMQQARGERTAAPLLVRWDATPVTERRPGLSRAGLPNQFDFILYRMDVEVVREGRTVRQFSFRKAGWEVARPINLEEQ